MKVYVVVPVIDVLMIAGIHEPLMPFVEVAGRAGALLFWQSGPIGVNAGMISGSMVIFMVTGVAHCPAVAVNV